MIVPQLKSEENQSILCATAKLRNLWKKMECNAGVLNGHLATAGKKGTG